jgi:hypothetical protein
MTERDGTGSCEHFRQRFPREESSMTSRTFERKLALGVAIPAVAFGAVAITGLPAHTLVETDDLVAHTHDSSQQTSLSTSLTQLVQARN